MTPRILFLDAYDSFSNNVVDCLVQQIGARVESIFIDDSRFASRPDIDFLRFLDGFDAVVAGPGPGNPTNAADVNLISRLWTLDSDHLLPVFGICLGFQSLAVAHGASVRRLRDPRHGTIARIQHCDTSLYVNAGDVRATLYNSLEVILDSKTSSAKLIPLAWATVDYGAHSSLMAVKHSSKPYWGVQYHPESVCTNIAGSRVFEAWWREANRWLHRYRPLRQCSLGQHIIANDKVNTPNQLNGQSGFSTRRQVHWQTVPLSEASTIEVWQRLQKMSPLSSKHYLLESGTRADGRPVNPETGRFSIVACEDVDSRERYEYYSSTSTLVHIQGHTVRRTAAVIRDLWQVLSDNIEAKYKAMGGPSATPFWGGFVGFASYEACLESINVKGCIPKDARPDAVFVFCPRSVVIDHVAQRIYVQTIRAADESWISDVVSKLAASSAAHVKPRERRLSRTDSGVCLRQKSAHLITSQPSAQAYARKIRECKDEISAGNSYELCLTAQTEVKRDLRERRPSDDAKDLYRRLRKNNPAPFGAFLQFSSEQGNVSILSSSPERFMSWTRTGRVQFRPIKGTVRKQDGVTRADAEAILSSPKEQAENLMIADLIRHDLHGVVGPGKVSVAKLMSVEEYETVYQLVSVIEGQLPDDGSKTGLDALVASLPPGSMTGAPKNRSCELLRTIEEDTPRGLYSGVLGYLDVGGGGDFSVVIRTAVNWESNTVGARPNEHEATWCIGAGGAITSQSNVQDEWAEMQGKRAALLDVFLNT